MKNLDLQTQYQNKKKQLKPTHQTFRNTNWTTDKIREDKTWIKLPSFDTIFFHNFQKRQQI